MPRCPACDERVSANDTECPHCGESLAEASREKGGAKKRKAKASSNSSLIIAILGAAFVGMFCCSGILIALLLPAVQQAREAARRTQCKNNLKQIGLAMHNYESTFRLFPAAHLNDSQGKPRLSWRVSILPFVDQAPLYNIYNFNDAWDGASNARIASTPIPLYICPTSSSTGMTTTCYVAISGDHTVMGAGKCIPFNDIKDGASNTLMVVEACGMNIPWIKPQDLDENAVTRVGDPNGISSRHVGGAHALMADGSVRFVSENVSPAVIQALITRDEGDSTGDF